MPHLVGQKLVVQDVLEQQEDDKCERRYVKVVLS